MSNNTAKKLVIKPFKALPKLPDDFELTSWNRLKAAIASVFKKTTSLISKEELYQIVEDLCKHKFAASIYTKLQIECAMFIESGVETLIGQTSSYTSFLALVDALWRDHIEQMNTIRNIFLYLDRSYTLQTPGINSIWEAGLAALRLSLDRQPEVLGKLIVSLFAAVEGHRRGLAVDKDILSRLIRMLVLLGFYVDRFEQPLLQDSIRFFVAEGQVLIESSDISMFMLHVDNRLREADVMTSTYLDRRTKQGLTQVIENNMLKPHLSTVIDRGLPSLLDDLRQGDKSAAASTRDEQSSSGSSDQAVVSGVSSSSSAAPSSSSGGSSDRFADLRRMFLLVERLSALDKLKAAWVSFIKRAGEVIVMDTTRDANMIDDLVVFQDKMDEVLKKSFHSQDGFRSAMKSAFEDFINHRQSKPSELLAKFVDRKMRGEKGVDDSDVELALDKIMVLFRYLQGKDVFEAFYKKLLAKRLLLGKSANFDLEKSMLSKLKTECGPNYTSKLEGMFQDVELSRDIMNQYTEHIAKGKAAAAATATSTGRRRPDIDFQCQVLTTGYWPTPQATDNIIVPPEIAALQERFLGFYNAKYQGRRLVWAHSSERCLITAHFPKGKKELEVSFLQAVVLLCFNKDEKQDIRTISTMTNIQTDELTRTLLSLACGVIGTRVLRKEPPGKDLLPGDVFSVNKEFAAKFFRIKINSIQLKETVEEMEKTHEEVFRDRQHQVDAMIVRTMKSRKTLSHNSLMAELMTQLKFPARTADLKKRIESLIEREFLMRDKDDSSIYVYLA